MGRKWKKVNVINNKKIFWNFCRNDQGISTGYQETLENKTHMANTVFSSRFFLMAQGLICLMAANVNFDYLVNMESIIFI